MFYLTKKMKLWVGNGVKTRNQEVFGILSQYYIQVSFDSNISNPSLVSLKFRYSMIKTRPFHFNYMAFVFYNTFIVLCTSS